MSTKNTKNFYSKWQHMLVFELVSNNFQVSIHSVSGTNLSFDTKLFDPYRSKIVIPSYK